MTTFSPAKVAMKEFKVLTIRLSPDQAEELSVVAAVDGQPVAEVIRMAITDHIEERKNDEAFQDSLRGRIDRAQRLLPGGSGMG